MIHHLARTRLSLAVLAALGLAAGGAHADTLVINDKLTGNATTPNNWYAIGGACLTAGNASTPTTSVPSCSSLAATGQPYNNKTQVGGVTGRIYPTPDPIGQGALRLTNGDFQAGSNGDYQTGAVVSRVPFPTNQGVQVTWTSVSYGGDGNNGTGADGMTFFLADGSSDFTKIVSPVGATGGSLGYSCSNGNPVADGVYGGYLGIGIDEYGNFGNKGDNTSTGPGAGANRIGVRGSGSTNFQWLSATYPTYYPATLSTADRLAAVQDTCGTGTLWNYSKGASKAIDTKVALPYNYNYLKNADGSWLYSDIPAATPIANQEATKTPLRSKAVPIVYSLKITTDGLLDFSYSINGGSAQSVIKSRRITDSNGPLPKNFRFGFAAGTGGGSNVHEITCFKAVPATESSTSAGSNVQESARVIEGSQLFLAYLHNDNWWGQVTAQSVVYDAASDSLDISSQANWDAGCVLTGGTCPTTGNNVVSAQDSANRQILTWNGSTGVPFLWNKLSAAQQTALTLNETKDDTRLRFLRGDRTTELTKGGAYRTRSGVLGDIVDSSPTWVGPPGNPYAGGFADKLNASATAPEGSSYATFASSNAARLNVVYVGANDGMLHGFRAGNFDANGNFVAAKNDGREVLAYVPAQALATIHSPNPNLDFSNSQYGHNYFVDATPGTGDLFYGGAWHTWVVGALGAGGQASGPVTSPTATAVGSVFALDVTSPGQFDESNAASLVIGELSSASFPACANVASGCGNYFGQAVGTPQIRRLHDGNWAILFGNGLNSANGTAGLYVAHVNRSSGAITVRYIDTGYGTAQDPQAKGRRNGIVQVTPADLDGDHITDFVYAGDVFGNLWRFDLTDADAAKWKAGAAPMFSTPAGQPITTRVTVTSVPSPSTGGNKVLVAFGTGQKLPQTLTDPATYATGSQALYGIWDWNMKAWNATSTDTKYDALAAPQAVTTAKLQAQSVTSTMQGSGDVSSYRTVSSNPICWSGSTACKTGNTQFGWSLALPTSSEQVIYAPISTSGLFVVNTIIPATQGILTCSETPASGYTMAVAVGTGGAASGSVFKGDSGTFTDQNISGIGVNGVGTVSVMSYKDKTYFLQQTMGSGTGSSSSKSDDNRSDEFHGNGDAGQRVNWTKIR